MHLREINKKEAVVMFFRPDLNATLRSEIDKVFQLLGLDPSRREFSLASGAFPRDKKEIAIITRSIFQIMIDQASLIEIPESHVAEGRAYPSSLSIAETALDSNTIIKVHTGSSRPSESFVTVRYQDNWFWIDNHDYRSKRMLAFLLLLLVVVIMEMRSG